jgi:hypothetical protein
MTLIGVLVKCWCEAKANFTTAYRPRGVRDF